MILHIVIVALPAGHDPAELQAVMAGLAGLDLPGFVGFEHGPNRDYEDRSAGYDYGFVGTFVDHAALEAYANDPEHQALGARLVALCGGVDGLMVIDLDS